MNVDLMQRYEREIINNVLHMCLNWTYAYNDSDMKENKLIAEFMEWDIDDPKTFPKPIQQPIYDGCWGDYRFQTSWDWLMPVVEKIECTSTDKKDNSDSFFNVMIEVFECNINGGNICICESGHNKREATYKAVVEFIKQYNDERNR